MNPDHYKTGGMEPIEYMRLKMTPEQFEGFLLGNVIKYVSRYQQKNGLEDLRKAQYYMDALVEHNEKRKSPVIHVKINADTIAKIDPPHVMIGQQNQSVSRTTV